MPNETYPLLVFPKPAQAPRDNLGSGRGSVSTPPIDRQRARLTPQFAALQQALGAKRLRLQQESPLENPELVLVLEVAGGVENFAAAVRRVPGLEWLVEWSEDQIAPDEDFHDTEDGRREKSITDRLFLLATNQVALEQLLALWNRYQLDPSRAMDHGLTPFKHVFAHLRTIRQWDVRDRIDEDMRQYWQDRIDADDRAIRFEIEAWYFQSSEKNDASRREIEGLLKGIEGRVLAQTIITEIAYYGLLVEVPATGIRAILEGEPRELTLSDRIMFFRPKTQSITDGLVDLLPAIPIDVSPPSQGDPLVALLDGLPLANHVLLNDRLIIDDPDGWEADYAAKDRVHGTAMASLILHGERDGQAQPLNRKLYARPIMRPDPYDGYNTRRTERTPDDVLLIDLVHRAVKRMCEGEANEKPVAPTVRVVNLSLGDAHRMFVREVSPWARLIDWLAHRYRLLFVVSAGNQLQPLTLDTHRNALAAMSPEDRDSLAHKALFRESADRRLLAPAESINALTVGALHADGAQPPMVHTRFDLFAKDGISPLSRIGHGYRRAIKPDLLMPGGRVLYMEQLIGSPADCVVELVKSSAAPGHRVAAPPLPGGTLGETAYCRGTSNAAALASRAASLAYQAVEFLRETRQGELPTQFDAVMIKALIVHGAQWGSLPGKLISELGQRPQFRTMTSIARRLAEKDFVTRWIGYGSVDVERTITCTDARATIIGVGELKADEAFVFSAPLPPGLASVRAWRRLTITLAWMSPINPAHLAYRRAKLWVTPPHAQLRVKRSNSVDDKAAKRGTVQHEILEGEDAVAFVDGARFECKVNCAADAGELPGKVAFALCVSLEVAIESGISVYQEIRARIAPQVPIQPGSAT